jgi:hypothetical protein
VAIGDEDIFEHKFSVYLIRIRVPCMHVKLLSENLIVTRQISCPSILFNILIIGMFFLRLSQSYFKHWSIVGYGIINTYFECNPACFQPSTA